MAVTHDAEESIRGYLVQHGLGPGDRLPSERQLATLLGVSRSSLRQALKSLSTAGVVDVRPGSGVYVEEPSLVRVMDLMARSPHPLSTPQMVAEARMVLEPSLAGLATRKASRDDTLRMEQALRVMERDLEMTGTFTLEHDAAFHLAIAHGAHNPLLEGVLGYLYNVQECPGWAGTRQRVLNTPGIGEELVEDHREILTAMQQRRPKRVEKLLTCHAARMLELIDVAMSKSRPQPPQD